LGQILKALYSRYRQAPKSGGLRFKILTIDGWEALVNDAEFLSDDFSITDLRLSYMNSRMMFKDEVRISSGLGF
jgi:hypothetical protein